MNVPVGVPCARCAVHDGDLLEPLHGYELLRATGTNAGDRVLCQVRAHCACGICLGSVERGRHFREHCRCNRQRLVTVDGHLSEPWRSGPRDDLAVGGYARFVARDAALLPREWVAPVDPCLVGLTVQLRLCSDSARAVKRSPLRHGIAVLQVVLVSV